MAQYSICLKINYGDPSPGLPRTLLAALEGRLSEHISVDSHQLGPPTYFYQHYYCAIDILLLLYI